MTTRILGRSPACLTVEGAWALRQEISGPAGQGWLTTAADGSVLVAEPPVGTRPWVFCIMRQGSLLDRILPPDPAHPETTVVLFRPGLAWICLSSAWARTWRDREPAA